MSNHSSYELQKDVKQKPMLTLGILQKGYSTFLFTAMSRKDWLESITKAFSLQYYFSVFVGMMYVKFALYLYDLMHAKNKNIGKVGAFTRECFCAIIGSLSIIIGLASTTAMATIGPWLVLCGFIVNIFYNVGVAIHNLYQFLTSSDDIARDYYSRSCKKHSISALLGVIATISLSMVLVFKIAVGPLTIFNACLSGIGFLGGVYSAVKTYREARKHKINKTIHHEVIAANDCQTKENKIDLTQSNESLLAAAPQVTKSALTNYYFYVKNRTSYINNTDNPQEYLLNEISDKLMQLTLEKINDHAKLFSQANKRNVKIRALVSLKSLILTSTNPDDFDALLQQREFNQFWDNPFQSFFRQTGDVLDIFRAAEAYFNQFRKKELAMTL